MIFGEIKKYQGLVLVIIFPLQKIKVKNGYLLKTLQTVQHYIQIETILFFFRSTGRLFQKVRLSKYLNKC